MAPRSNWKGYLKLSMVSCPVKMYTATTRSHRLSFNLLHKESHERVQMKPYIDGKGIVDRSDLVKGFEYEKNNYVVLDADDFEKAKIESSDALVIEQFIDEDSVDRVYVDEYYYLVPNGAVADDAYRVIHEAMRKRRKVALSRIVLGSRERLVLLSCRDQGFLVSTLRSVDEVQDSALYFGDISEAPIDREMLVLAEQLIDQKSGAFRPADFTDRYEESLLEIIRAKRQGQEPVIAEPPAQGTVVNLMEALKQSLVARPEIKPAAPGKRRRTAKPVAGKESEKKAIGS